jgi:hypothetical protein
MKQDSPAEKEYWRRINRCTRAIIRAGKAVGLDGGATGEYQGCDAGEDRSLG